MTLQLIEELLLQLSTATDSLGVPVLSVHMVTIWEEEKKHLKCIRDPSGVALYTLTRYITVLSRSTAGTPGTGKHKTTYCL